MAHENKGQRKIYSSRRRALKAGVESDGSTLKELIALYGNRCLCCGAETGLTVDHIVPLTINGSDLIENKQPLCGRCNDRKGTQIIDYRSKK